MNWKAFLATVVIALIITFLQLPRMKDQPKKDKVALISILVIGLVLSMFHLEQIKGPVTFREELIKPLSKYMQKQPY